jgi:hypothetical protein
VRTNLLRGLTLGLSGSMLAASLALISTPAGATTGEPSHPVQTLSGTEVLAGTCGEVHANIAKYAAQGRKTINGT